MVIKKKTPNRHERDRDRGRERQIQRGDTKTVRYGDK